MCHVIKWSDAAVCYCHVFILWEKLLCTGTYFQNWKYFTTFQICHSGLVSVVSVRIQKRKGFGERLLLFYMCVLLFILRFVVDIQWLVKSAIIEYLPEVMEICQNYFGYVFLSKYFSGQIIFFCCSVLLCQHWVLGCC